VHSAAEHVLIWLKSFVYAAAEPMLVRFKAFVNAALDFVIRCTDKRLEPQKHKLHCRAHTFL
jgi:hypothetical protein